MPTATPLSESRPPVDAERSRPATPPGAVSVVLAGVVAAAVGSPLGTREHGLAIVAAALLGSVWAFIGLRRRALPRPLYTMLLAATATNLLFITVWASPAILGRGGTLAQPSLADPGFVVADLLLAAALVTALTRRERVLTVLLDLAAIAVGTGMILGFLVVGRLLARAGTALGDVSALAYLTVDAVLIACVLRLLVSPRGRPPALWLLAGSAAALAATDILRNEALITSASRGAWVDLGWGIAPLLLGVAALHPSLRRLGAAKRVGDDMRATSVLVLGLSSLIAPLMLALPIVLPALPDIDRGGSAAVLAGGAVVAALVVTHFMLLVRRGRELADTAQSALDERDRMLERSETRYRQLVELVPAVVILFELGPTGPVPVYVSPQSRTILGVDPDEWVADPTFFARRIHPEDLAMLETELQALQSGGTPTHPEFRFTRPDGEEVWVRDVSGVITEEPDGAYLQAMLVDITEAKRAEGERERMENELRLAQKLEAVGQLAAGIAHEINTPIQFVGDTLHFLQDAFSDLLRLTEAGRELRVAAESGNVSLELLQRVRDDEELADLEYLTERVPAAFERGVDGVSRVAAIVRAMRDFAHPPTSEKTPVDLVSALHDALIVAMNAYKYVAEVETDFEELPDVMCNGGEINQVFLNLVVNAAHAIESVVADSGEQGTIILRTRRDGDHVLVSVADTGCGITADIASRVFDPFFTTKEVGRGTGQGLALARTMVVDNHGGTLTFETEPGAGTTFHVRLPVGSTAELLEAA